MAVSRLAAVTCVTSMASILALNAAFQSAFAQDETGFPQATDAHKLLHQDVGTWEATISIWPEEGAKPKVSKGTEKNELLPGGMWLASRFEGKVLGMPFTGVGTFGYDPVEKKYVGTWVDSLSPHLTVMKGDYDAATKTMTASAEGRDFETGEIETSKHISRYIDENTRTFEIHSSKDGEERKVMEIKYSRRSE